MGMKVAMIAVGITMATRSVTESLWRNRNRMRAVRAVPVIMSRNTFQMESAMNSPSSKGMDMVNPGGRVGTIRSSISLTPLLA